MRLDGLKPCPCGAGTVVVETDGVVSLSHRHDGVLHELSAVDVPDAAKLVDVWNRYQDDHYGEA
jgi:hypothetical protein